jgi:hypothetical protein
MAATKLPGFKPIPAGIDRELAGSLTAIQEALEVRLGRRGDSLDRAITLRELIDSGLATQLAQSPYNPNTGATGFAPIGERPGDVIVPPAPTVLTAAVYLQTLFYLGIKLLILLHTETMRLLKYGVLKRKI